MNSKKKREQQWEDRLRAMSEKEWEDMKLPESLRPENIKEKILQYEQEQQEQKKQPSQETSGRVKGRANWRKRAGITMTAVAAALALFVGVGNSDLWQITRNDTSAEQAVRDEKAESMAESEDMAVTEESADCIEKEVLTDAEYREQLREQRENLDGVVKLESYDELMNFYKEKGLIERREEEKVTFIDKLADIFNGGTKDVVTEDAMEETTVDFTTSTTADGGVSMEAGGAMPEGAESESADDFSDTNVQVEGVDESDIIKTDGTHIYRLSNTNDEIVIYRAEGAQVTLVSTIPLERFASEEVYRSYNDMLLMDGKLVVLGSMTVYEKAEEKPWYEPEPHDTVVLDEAEADEIAVEEPIADVYYDCVVYRNSATFTEMTVFDVSNPAAPQKITTRTQEGGYQDVRMVDGIIYLMSYKSNSRYYTCDEREEKAYFEECYIPLVDGENLPCDRIYVPEDPQTANCVVITSTDIRDPYQHIDSVAILGDCAQMYVSNSNIYLWQTEWQWWTPTEENPETITTILKYSYADGILSAGGSAQIQGYLNNSFSLDEYQGHLRVVATREYEKVLHQDENSSEVEWTTENQLFVFNEKMQMVGRIQDLAPGEFVKSARFFGDIGYFVTFRQTDPLFSVDLSDPTNPTIIGALKIPGFSEYLHPYGPGLLLGIGQEADVNTGGTEGVKLSMFDISDPTNVKEIAKYLVRQDAEYSYSEAEYNHRAVLASVTKNVIGFNLEWSGYRNTEYGSDWYNQNGYMVFSYDPVQGFVEKAAYNFSDWNSFYGCRGIYIGEYLYIVTGCRQVVVYHMNDWSLCGDYTF